MVSVERSFDLRTRVTDARGRSVTLLDPLTMHSLGWGRVIEPDVLARIAEEIEPGAAMHRRVVRIFVPITLVVVGIVIGGVILSVLLEGPSARADLMRTLTNPATWVGSLGGIVVLPWIIVAARRKQRGRVLSALLRHGRCPHCGYALADIPVAADGATVCPECAGAWRLHEQGNTQSQIDAAPLSTASRLTIPILLSLVGLTALAVAGTLFLLLSR